VTALSTFPRRVAKRTVRVSSLAVRRFGVDITETLAGRTSLVVAPHPDDETLGCGATIARMRSQGTAVHVVFVSGGGSSPVPAGVSHDDLVELRRTEAASALAVLGVDRSSITHCEFEDGDIVRHRDAVTDVLTELLRRHAPDQVLVTSADDRHPDHVAVAMAARTAVARSRERPALYEYPIWQRVPALNFARGALLAGRTPSAAQPPQSAGRPRYVRAQEFLVVKQQALGAYESQLPHFPLGFIDDFLLPFESFTEIAFHEQC
jgi:LmbE family N-acetylglucosaminyl deacetylase